VLAAPAQLAQGDQALGRDSLAAAVKELDQVRLVGASVDRFVSHL
jgi:hypothetical protein